MRIFRIILITATLLSVATVCASETVSQRQWMISLVDILGRSFGLPDQPRDDDFLKILDGSRQFSIEAEETLEQTSRASVQAYETFGPFSGTGWVGAASEQANLRLRFNLLLAGTYRATAVIQSAGHHIRLGNRSLGMDGGAAFTPVELEEVELNAGPIEIELSLPPNGAIDRIDFFAPALRKVVPPRGWDPEAPLSTDVLASTLAKAALIDDLLPTVSSPRTIEIESASDLGAARVSGERHLGEPSGGAWVRAAASATEVNIPFKLEQGGTFHLALTHLGDQPITGTLNERHPLSLPPAPYLQKASMGTFSLSPGNNLLQLFLPPGCGADVLTLEQLDTSAKAYRELTGLTAVGDTPSPAEVDRILKLLITLKTQD